MAHAQKLDFVFPRNGRVHSNRQGRQFSRLLAVELYTSACRVCTAHASLCSAVMWRLLATHSTILFPLHFSSRASPCAITFQKQSTHSPIGSPITAAFLPFSSLLHDFLTTLLCAQLNLEAAGFFETSVQFCQNKRRGIRILQNVMDAWFVSQIQVKLPTAFIHSGWIVLKIC